MTPHNIVELTPSPTPGHPSLEPGGGRGEEEGSGRGRRRRGHPQEVPPHLPRPGGTGGGGDLDDPDALDGDGGGGLDGVLDADEAARADLGLRQPQPAAQAGDVAPQLVFDRPRHAAAAGRDHFGAVLTWILGRKLLLCKIFLIGKLPILYIDVKS